MELKNSPQLEIEFSRKNQAENYLRYRPTYPISFLDAHVEPLITEIRKTKKTVNALDLCCGSGQLTYTLLKYFDFVLGADFNEEQLENARIRDLQMLQSGRVLFQKLDCSKIDELFECEAVKQLNIDFVFVGEAFHFFDYAEFLTRFNKIPEERRPVLIIIAYRLDYHFIKDSENYEPALRRFLDTLKPFFHFDLNSLNNAFQEFDFKQFFDSTQFVTLDQEIVDAPIKNFAGFLDSLGGYRNCIDHFKNDPTKDPLVLLLKDLGLENYETKDYDNLCFPEGAPKTLSYKHQFFMYLLK